MKMTSQQKDPFAKISTFAKLKEVKANKKGQHLAITDFALTDRQAGELTDLSVKQTEITITIQPSRRGTLYAGMTQDSRITAESAVTECDAVTLLALEAGDAMRMRMIEELNAGNSGWDNPENAEQFRKMAIKKIRANDDVDALNYLMMARNLAKDIIASEDTEFEETEPEPSLLDGQE